MNSSINHSNALKVASTTKVIVNNLGKVFEQSNSPYPALQDVNLTIGEGEFVTLVGASGCGKSTLLRILAGLELHTSGELLCDLNPIEGPGADRAMVFQHYSLYPWLNVIDNIKFSRRLMANREQLSLSDVEAAQGRAEALLELIGLQKFANAFPNQLSGGMQQRVAIARALLGRPSMLLMDEPFGALDAQSREVMHDLILHIHSIEKTTIVFVTHDVEEAIYLGQRVVVMKPRPGKVQEIIPVPLPAQRHQEMKHTTEFRALKNTILDRIRESAGMETDADLLSKLNLQSTSQ